MVTTALFAGRERVDLPDLAFATSDSIRQAQEQLNANFLAHAGQASVVSGFVPSGSGQGPVAVGAVGTANVAILPYLVAGQLNFGRFSCDAPATQNVSVASLQSGTYGIFIRATTQPDVTQQRVFWDGSQLKEIAQLTATRTVASWEARVESTAPSAEWVQIGQVTITQAGSGQGSTITVADQRPLFFEGSAQAGYAPVWGTAADRGPRQSATIADLQTMVDALKSCLVDIKGRGLCSWSSPNIGGLMVGSRFQLTDNPSPDAVVVGDNRFGLTNPVGGSPALAWDYTNDLEQFNRSTGEMQRLRGGNVIRSEDPTGALALGGSMASRIYPAALHVRRPANPVAYFENQGSGFGQLFLGCSDGSGAYLGLSDSGVFGGGTISRFGLWASWSGNPTLELQSRAGVLLRSLNTGSAYNTSLYATGQAQVQGATVLVNATGQLQVLGAPFFWSSRQFVYGMMPYAAGNYLFNTDGNQTPGVRLVGVSGIYVNYVNNLSGTRGIGPTQEMTFSGATLPANPICIITPRMPVYQSSNYQTTYRCTGTNFYWSGNTLVVQFRNDNNEVTFADFDFTILCGA